MKKAVIVTLQVSTRVVVDVDENGKINEENELLAIDEAIGHVKLNPDGYLCADNLVSIEEDKEIPFGEGDSGTYEVHVADIEWDIDDEDDEDVLDELPKEGTLVLTEEEYKEFCEDYDYVTDFLSDKYGYCVVSCSVEG